VTTEPKPVSIDELTDAQRAALVEELAAAQARHEREQRLAEGRATAEHRRLSRLARVEKRIEALAEWVAALGCAKEALETELRSANEALAVAESPGEREHQQFRRREAERRLDEIMHGASPAFGGLEGSLQSLGVPVPAASGPRPPLGAALRRLAELRQEAGELSA